MKPKVGPFWTQHQTFLRRRVITQIIDKRHVQNGTEEPIDGSSSVRIMASMASITSHFADAGGLPGQDWRMWLMD